jgi:hypothetical protein
MPAAEALVGMDAQKAVPRRPLIINNSTTRIRLEGAKDDFRYRYIIIMLMRI